MIRRLSSLATLLALTMGLVLVAVPAGADHTDPTTPLSPVEPGLPGAPMRTDGEGTWEFIRNFPPNPGTDLKFIRVRGELFAASGTIGQGAVAHVGQRMLRLVDRDGNVDPQWVADHGSAACNTANPTGTLGLQHDSQWAHGGGTLLLTDTTDATGRCHDPSGGGIEIIDASGIGRDGFEPREIHITRHAGFSHTHTVDSNRPWIIYNSSSDFAGRPWIDVLDVRTCLGLRNASLADKRDACRPEVYRIPFEPEWSRMRNWHDGELRPGTEAACHDITSQRGRIYCAGLNATLVFDVRNLTDANGNVRGTPLECQVIDGTNTGAKVTNCAANEGGAPQAEGWEFLGTFNHPGRDCAPPPLFNTSCNSNLFVESEEGVSVSHEADPLFGRRYMAVTDERGGGVVPPGASCSEGIDNPIGNGGMHIFDLRNLPDIEYALQPDGSKAVWRSQVLNPAPTFCDIHVIAPVPGEHRLTAAYYSSGAKIVDYFLDENGRWTFDEVASMWLPGANTWAFEQFKIDENEDGTRTYYFLASDIQRGIDIFSWTGPPNPAGRNGASRQGRTSGVAAADAGMLVLGLVMLPVAALIGRRRRSAR